MVKAEAWLGSQFSSSKCWQYDLVYKFSAFLLEKQLSFFFLFVNEISNLGIYGTNETCR